MKKILLTILTILVTLFIILLYSRFVATTGLKTNDILIKDTINESYSGLKIIHFSDLHYKKVITKKRVEQLIQEINKNNPDLVLFTGDLLDKDYQIQNKDINFLIQQLKKIKSTYGIYAVMGDQDYSNEEVVTNIYIQSNITLLKNETTYIYNQNHDKIMISGLESENKIDLDKTYSQSQEICYKITLVHEPDEILKILKKDTPNLLVAGHSIDGSINIPGIRNILLPTGSKEYEKKKNTLKDKNIYISNGIGVNNINFRLFNTPSINLYRIILK